MRSSRTANDKFLTYIFMPEGTSDATYAKIVAVLSGDDYVVTTYAHQGWVAAVADATL